MSADPEAGLATLPKAEAARRFWDAPEAGPASDFRQAWRQNHEEGFAPGRVRVGWSSTGFVFHAQLTDRYVTTRATASGERLWELGDVLEVFIRAEKSDRYWELHVAPNGLTLQLEWPGAAAFGAVRGTPDLSPFQIREPVFEIRVRRHAHGWEAAGEVFGGALSSRLGLRPGPGTQWRLSFGRYDYGLPGSSPVISSTSPHPMPDFHRQEDWARVVCGD